MLCKICYKELSKKKWYEIDIYRYGFSININYLSDFKICEKCFNDIEKTLKEKRRLTMEDLLRGVIVGSFLSTEEKQNLIEYLETLIDKAWKYDELNK